MRRLRPINACPRRPAVPRHPSRIERQTDAQRHTVSCAGDRGGCDMRKVFRIVLTILMYAGVLVFIYPYLTGRITTGIGYMIAGAVMTVVCGLLRCYLTEGDC